MATVANAIKAHKNDRFYRFQNQRVVCLINVVAQVFMWE